MGSSPSPRKLDIFQTWSEEQIWKLVALGRIEKFSHGQLVSKDITNSAFITFICKVRSDLGAELGRAGLI